MGRDDPTETSMGYQHSDQEDNLSQLLCGGLLGLDFVIFRIPDCMLLYC